MNVFGEKSSIQGISQMAVQAFRTGSGYFGESQSVFEKCPSFIRSSDMRGLINFIKTFNWRNSGTPSLISMKISENE